MAMGTVKWFNNAKGYGFVLSEDKGEDLFIHYSSIQMDGYKSLKAGQQVQYDVQEGPKGKHAINIRASEVSGEGASTTDKAPINPPVTGVFTDDNLHLNPMHNIPKSAPALPAAKDNVAVPAAETEAALE